ALRIMIGYESGIERNTGMVAATLTSSDEGPAIRIKQAEQKWDSETYLLYLATECNRLSLSVIDPQYIKPSGEGRIALLDVYTDLRTTSWAWEHRDGRRLSAGKPKSGISLEFAADSDLTEQEWEAIAEEVSSKPTLDLQAPPDSGWKRVQLSAVEVIAESKSSKVVLLGDPGSGKSTFINYLALCLTKAQLEPNENWLGRLKGWPHSALLPVRII